MFGAVRAYKNLDQLSMMLRDNSYCGGKGGFEASYSTEDPQLPYFWCASQNCSTLDSSYQKSGLQNHFLAYDTATLRYLTINLGGDRGCYFGNKDWQNEEDEVIDRELDSLLDEWSMGVQDAFVSLVKKQENFHQLLSHMLRGIRMQIQKQLFNFVRLICSHHISQPPSSTDYISLLEYCSASVEKAMPTLLHCRNIASLTCEGTSRLDDHERVQTFREWAAIVWRTIVLVLEGYFINETQEEEQSQDYIGWQEKGWDDRDNEEEQRPPRKIIKEW